MRIRDLAWAAGIVDGEGCITLYKATTNSGIAYVMKVTVVNTSLTMLQRLHTLFGIGYIGIRPRRSKKHKRIWIWEVTTKNAEVVLKAIQPYLVAKVEECRLALLSRTMINTHGRNTPNNNAAALDEILSQLQKIKHVSS